MQKKILDFIKKERSASFLQIKAKFVKSEHAYFETKEDKQKVREIDKALFHLIKQKQVVFICGRYYDNSNMQIT